MARFEIKSTPTLANNVVMIGDILRISVLSERILRIEMNKNGDFCDKPTQFVYSRSFQNPYFTYQEEADKVVITTKMAIFYVNKKSLKVRVLLDGKIQKDCPLKNLKGTARTLDGNFGFVSLNKGLMSKSGVSIIDDSKTCVLEEDGSVSARLSKGIDKYVFAFGDDYLGGLKEYYSLTGFTPKIPKHAFGNWWSRYYAYNDKEYLALMDTFKERDLPITVATIDMDWHLVKGVPRDKIFYNPILGAGWTGYTFNEKLFPDYKGFLKALKDRDLAITMNLHPHSGIRHFETQYQDMAKANGIDPISEKPVKFDLVDSTFRNTYFDIVHHPYEEDGVDFWWIDWQQGKKTKIKGLDPLWLLNHYHYLDNSRDKDGLILSRYAGPGSHRYPLGFSGDTMINWMSLKLQPYFTASSTNIGYTWWSHDIGGHIFGLNENQLYLRWVQLGVFSPINRLHSSNIARTKEPWLYPKAEKIAIEFLRLRHLLLPYLYTANILTAEKGIPLVSPLYYLSKEKNAYSKKYKTDFGFGSELIVCPITNRADRKGNSLRKIWLPKGTWTDFFSGRKYQGGEHHISCTLDSYPVFAKEGAIIPMIANRQGNSMSFDELDIRIYKGNNSFTMYDEKGSIEFDLQLKGKDLHLSITPKDGIETSKLNLIFEDLFECEIRMNGEVLSKTNKVTIPLAKCTIVVSNIK